MQFGVFGLLLLTGFSAHAEERLISSRTVVLPVEVSTATVKLSAAGYSRPLVKILVPALAAETFLNHRNEGETAPCLSTTETTSVFDVVSEKVEDISLKIDLVKELTPDPESKICRVSLRETISAEISGFAFGHVRETQLPDRVLEDCR